MDKKVMTKNTSLLELQKLILGGRNEPLSSMEVRDLLSHQTTPESVLYVLSGLMKDKLEPNIALIQSIASATKKEDMVNVGLAIRYGADPNLYVNTPNVGDIHILGYTYLFLKDRDQAVLNSVVIMLMASGADPNLPIFDCEGGIIKDEFSLMDPLKGQSVISWLDSQGYDTIIPIIRKNYDEVNAKFMTTLATFLDRGDLIKTQPRLDEVIGSHATKIFNQYEARSDIDMGLVMSVNYLNLETFENYISKGADIPYSMVNKLIIKIKNYYEDGDLLSMAQTRDMLLFAISNGTPLDTYQYAMIIPEIKPMVDKAYQVPYWRKICNNTQGSVPFKLKLLAYRLNLYPEYPRITLCNQIRKISEADPTIVKKSIISRQKSRIRSDVALITEFDNDQPPVINCGNRSILSSSLYDYPDSDIAYYMDENNTLWCFSSNNFERIIQDGKNPYTQVEFPPFFITDVKNQNEFIENYRSIGDMPVPISETVDNLQTPDKISNDHVNMDVDKFKELMALNGLTDLSIKNIPTPVLEKILLDGLGLAINLTPLGRIHAEITFYVTAYNKLMKNKDLIEDFFQQIEDVGAASKIKNK